MFIHRTNTQYVFHTTWAWLAAWGPRAGRMGPCCNVLRWCHMYSPGGSSAGGLSSTPPVNKTVGLPGLHTSLSEHHGLTIHITSHFMFDLPFTLHAISCPRHHSHYDSPFTLHATSCLPFTVHAISCLIHHSHYTPLHIYHSHYMPLHVWVTIHITCHFMFDLLFTLHATSCLLYHSHYMPLNV